MKNPNPATFYEVSPVSSIRSLLDQALTEAAEKTAFRYRLHGNDIADVSYRDFIRDVNAIGSALTELGVIGEHIAQIGENSYRWVTVYLAALAGKGVYVPIDKDLPDADLLGLLTHSDAGVLFYTAPFEELLRSHADSTLSGIRYFIRVAKPDSEPVDADVCSSLNSSRFLDYDALLQRGYALLDDESDASASYRNHQSAPNELKMIVYTSGTTGMAKGVMLSEHNLVSLVYYGLQISTVYDTCLSVLPYHHTYEAVAGLLVALHHHSTICINESLRAVMKNLITYKPDYIYLVPAFAEEFYRKIWSTAKKTNKEKGLTALIKTSNSMRKVGIDARSKLFASIHESFGGNLRKIVCGGAPIRPELGEFFDAIGIPLINGYGITECSPLVAANTDTRNDWNTVGYPLPCCELSFDDVTPEGIGEICVRGDTVMLGYYKQPDVTADVLSADGWFHTGDYGKLNEQGQLMITGRKKNIIVLSNGKNVYPEEIENYIQNIPYVSEVVVYGLKNEFGEEYKLCAEVFLNAEKVTEFGITDPASSLKKDIANVCAPLPVYKNIGKIVIRTKEFDKTTTNKIKRQSISGNITDTASSDSSESSAKE